MIKSLIAKMTLREKIGQTGMPGPGVVSKGVLECGGYGEFIRKYRPFLNTQIPLEEDWHKYKTVPIDVQTARFFMT